MAHTYSPRFRVTPMAGPAATTVLSTMSWNIKAQPMYEPIANQHEIIDRSMEQTRYGYRCRVALDFEFETPSTDETSLASILTSAEDDNQMIELSLDGGTTYREVLLEEFNQEALDGKNIGIAVQSVWVCKDILTTKPAVGSGSW